MCVKNILTSFRWKYGRRDVQGQSGFEKTNGEGELDNTSQMVRCDGGHLHEYVQSVLREDKRDAISEQRLLQLQSTALCRTWPGQGNTSFVDTHVQRHAQLEWAVHKWRMAVLFEKARLHVQKRHNAVIEYVFTTWSQHTVHKKRLRKKQNYRAIRHWYYRMQDKFFQVRIHQTKNFKK
ncbi:hypothetical protein RFI_11812 [Reticulomyxa filosa]|uniref:Uncharacterized protein n=1 Tax=Reticulomyxa filosa TaxID=46433 RepID=X6NH72_RETFI|nr:hypothetical protein RFI_11812 [Reticulomyxa filosa]|eukprot:ETO25326.1 hypothetical protein RFI_11812 [Reticulomyxa filosa]